MNEEARERALRLLDKRDYSRKMLLDKLTEKGVAPADAEEVTDWICSLGVVDDVRYAGLVVRHYAAKGYGERRIRDELYRRGIDKELWDEALEEMPGQDGALDAFLRGRLRGKTDPDSLRRAAAAAQRRGYGWQEVRQAIERLEREEET